MTAMEWTGRSRKKISGLFGNQLKMIGIASMVLDHIGILLLPAFRDCGAISSEDQYRFLFVLFRVAGRLSFPIFAFLLTEGFRHTRDVKKYLFRLGIFALLSEIPFDLAINRQIIDFSIQNIFFTLFIGLLTMCGINKWRNLPILQWIASAVGIGASLFFKTDYAGPGIVLILVFYIFQKGSAEWFLASAAVMICLIETPWEVGYLAALPFLMAYNGKQKKGRFYGEYWIYPLHLLVLVGIRQMILWAGRS